MPFPTRPIACKTSSLRFRRTQIGILRGSENATTGFEKVLVATLRLVLDLLTLGGATKIVADRGEENAGL